MLDELPLCFLSLLDDSEEMSKGSEGVTVEALPRVCLHDVPTDIVVSGCPPCTPVTITMDTYNDEGKKVTYFHFNC